VEGTRYPWEEYLLFHKARGFTWLMQSNGHWVYLKPIEAGDVSLVPGVAAHYEGRRYKAFQAVSAVTETVLGEFYWEVHSGEMAQAVEYVAPPYSVNEDATSNEVTYSHGEYLAPSVIQQAFKLKEPLPPPQGVAPSQPNPHKSTPTWKWSAIWATTLAPDAVAGQPSAIHFSEPFQIHKRGNVRADVSAPVSNDWIGVQGDLVNQDTGEVTSFYQEISYYHGSDSDGSWTEGGTSETEYLSAVEPGNYVLRTTAAFGGGLQPGGAGRSFRVQLTSGTPRGSWFGCAFVMLLIGPLFAFIRSSSFESTRWAESNLSSDS
jgi:hypothetical protein